MDILNNKSLQMVSFFTALDELSATIQQDLQNRTPHLNGEKYLTNREVCQLLHISSRTLQNWRDTGKNTFYSTTREDSVQGIGYCEMNKTYFIEI